MTHKLHMIIDLQYGSTGKGLLAGYLAKRENYEVAVCSFAPNAGHTYIDGMTRVMTQQLPTAGIVSKTVKYILIGPGALVDINTLKSEMAIYSRHLAGKRILVHPRAAIVGEHHILAEKSSGYSKIGSTTKGVGEAAIQRIRRDPDSDNTAGGPIYGKWLDELNVLGTDQEYREILDRSEGVIVEGAQGFSLSMYHGQYPYTTSRDVTPWQIAADCGLPFKWASTIQIFGTLRTYPIRVNNRDGTSGPCYPDQREIMWKDIGIEPEMTTVTRLPRRIFTFSVQQLKAALWHCGHYWKTELFLNFANYMTEAELHKLIFDIETSMPNPPKISWIGFGPDDSQVVTREAWISSVASSEGGEL
jgi:adenylosuccinate synthase